MHLTKILFLTLACFSSYAAAAETVKVLPGETLMTFSNRVYGTHQKWRQILKWNKDIIKDPNRIEPGLALKVEDMAPKAEVATTVAPEVVKPEVVKPVIAKPVKPSENRRKVASDGARVIYPASEKPISEKRAERREVEEVEVAPDRSEERLAPSESTHTPAGRAAIFPGVQHPDPDSEPLEPFSSLEVPK